MTDTNLATIDKRPMIVVLRERLDARKNELKNALPDDIKPEQFIRTVITAATINPNIQACSWTSLWLACMQACRDGLLPDGKQGAIVPYKDRATWIPMYRGLVSKFMKSGQFKEIAADVVRQGEEFQYYRDQNGVKFLHRPGDDENAPITKIYAIANTLDGGIFVSVLTIGEANKIRNMSRATREDAPWKLWPAEMYKKTALRRLSKLLPTSDDLLGDDAEVNIPISAEAEPAREQEARSTAPLAALPRDDDASADATTAEHGEVGEPAATDLSAASDAVVSAADLDQPETEDQRKRRDAYQRGKDAKAAGHKRTAVPGELRDDNQLAMAWTLGWMGEPFKVTP